MQEEKLGAEGARAEAVEEGKRGFRVLDAMVGSVAAGRRWKTGYLIVFLL